MTTILLNKEIAKNVTKKIKIAIDKIAEEEGLCLKKMKSSYSDSDLRTSLYFILPIMPDGTSWEKKQWDKNCGYYFDSNGKQLKPEYFGKWLSSPIKAKVIGLSAKSNKYPVIVAREDGTQFKVRVDAVTKGLSKGNI